MKNNVPVISLFLCLLAVCPTRNVHAAASEAIDLGLSATSYQMNRQAGSESGKTSATGSTFYHLYVQGNIDLGKKATFSPNLRYAPSSLFPQKSPDGASTSSLATLSLPLLWHSAGHAFAFGSGLTLLRYEIEGKGGTKVLNNGGGQATFGLPGRKVASTTAGLSVISQFQWQRLLLSLDLLAQGLGSTEKRSMSLSLALAYGIGGR